MPVQEAIQVLQVPENFTAEIVEERFDKLFKMNDPTKGGSLYIQCKVMGAKLALLKTLKPPEDKEEDTLENSRVRKDIEEEKHEDEMKNSK